MILEIKELVAGYGKIEVLHGISMRVAKGEIVTMVGANGAGKTTTLRSIFGQTGVRSGQIMFEGQDITARQTHRLVGLGLAFVPQERSIFPSLSVGENLQMGGYTLDQATMGQQMDMVYGRFPVLKERRTQRAGTLSGGERQMLAIGRGLMVKPRLMLLDEPSLGLAPKIIEIVFDQIKAISQSGTTILLVEQNARRALALADRGYVMELGRIRSEGSGQELLNDEAVQQAYLGTASPHTA
jgi:branched-chain amino acid transport system ATP-binding protein